MEQMVLGGRYLLKDKVGAGGMATVYRAQDQVLDRTVAVKIMLPQYAADATFAARFKQEAQAAAGLQSPYIVGVYDWGKDGDTYYIVMEYLRGTDLKSGIRSHGALDPKKVAQIGSQIAGALSVAHKHEIIHRDIKPQNIMVLPDGNIKVMDFGIARAKNSHLTQDNNVLGTAHYVSPEQARGQELGPTSDIYSLGVVMYECATGQVPFDGEDAISVAVKQMNELPVPPSQINPRVDADLERIILRCMEKDPANRFQTADELRQVLNSYLAGRSVDLPEPTRVISAAPVVGATETRVMTDQTRAMARPGGAVTSAGMNASAFSGNTGAYDDGSKRGGKGKIIAIVIAAIAVVAAVAVFALGALGSGGGVKVPNVIGMDQDAAVQDLREAGFKNIQTDQEFNEADEGTVVDQSPKSGEQVDKDATIYITISKGPEPVEYVDVPQLTGMTEDEAEAELARLGLKGKATHEENEAEKGKVFDQDPAVGEQIEKGGTVEYKVSDGPDTVEVPNVVGNTQADAERMIADAGLASAVGSSSYSGQYPAGYVIDYSPKGNVAPGTTITLTISLGAEPSFDPTSVIGQSQSSATSTLRSNGYSVTVEEDYSGSGTAGTVIDVIPNGESAVIIVVATEGDTSES